MRTIKISNYLKSRLLAFVFFTLALAVNSNAQVIKAFAQRPAAATPATLIYNIKGDYTMIGNTNLTLQTYGNNTNNSNNIMEYVDVDGDPNTFNSSSATLGYSTENGAIPACSNVLFAGLYWTGRASNNSNSSPEQFNVTKGAITKTFNKRKIQLKGPGQSSYTEFEANLGNIYYPDGAYGNMYSAFVEVTDYVDSIGVGEYTVGDMALVEGNGGGTGYYGGWGLIVVYENSQMNWRDVTIFDGHAYIRGNATVNYELPVSGFNTAQAGPINMKLGLMAGEGDVGISGDYFRVRNWQDNAWVTLDHPGNSTTNFFNGSIQTGGNPRTPNLQNNTGLDIAMFNVPNPGNSVVTNSQTSTRFQYGSTQDTYILFCIAMSVDAYIPDVESVVSTETIDGVPVGAGPITVTPGQDVEYKVQIKNLGTEAVDSAVFVVPIPYTTSFVPGSITTLVNFSPLPTPDSAYFDPLLGPTGSVVWVFGTLPLIPTNLDSILAELTFHLEVTTDCYVLTNPDCPPQVVLTGGATSGVGAVSGSEFDMPFIQGYQSSGVCIGEPITEPLVLNIDATQYIIDSCANEPTSRDFLFCNFVNASIPFDSIAQDFPLGVSFYNENNITPTSIEYDENNPFPATPGTTTYFAIPDGSDFCYYTFSITVQDPILSIAVQSSPVSCLGGTDGAIDLTILAGISPFTYDWSGPAAYSAATQDISSLLEGTYNVTITDSIGCTASDAATVVTTPDVTDPIILCPTDITVDNDAGVCGAIINYTAPVGVDECSGTSTVLTQGLAPGQLFPIGTTLVEYTVTDSVGNTAVCSFNVTVTDAELPQITCPPMVSANADLTLCTVVAGSVSLGTPVTSDNCGVASVTNNAPATYPVGTTTVTWTVTDIHGNTATCTQDVVVTDIEAPAFTSCGATGTQNVVVSPGVCTYTQTGTAWDATATDNCTVSTIVYTLTGATTGTGTTLNGVVFNLDTTTVTWVVSDVAGNADTCTFDVIVTDSQDPVISSCGATGTQNVVTDFGVCTHINTGIGWDATATDNCGIASLSYILTGVTTGTGTTLNGVTFNLGTTTVTWTAVDNTGNTSTCTFDVVTTDTQDPVIVSCGGSGTEPVVSDPGACTYTQTGTGWDATATDNCTVTSLSYALTGSTTGTGTSLSGVVFNLGTTNVVWTAVDTAGNTATCSFDVAVTDTQDPVISNCASLTNQTEVTDVGVCSYTQTGTAWDATATDNCTVTSLSYALTGSTTGTGTTLNGITFNLGITNVVWTAVDTAGNTTTCSFDVTVTDTQDPVISNCASLTDQSEVTDSGVCTYTQAGTAWDAIGTDNCTVSSLTYVLTGVTTGTGTTLNGVVFNLGITNVVWTVVDTAGNTATCSFDVTVTDTQDPVISSCGATGTQNVVTDFGVCTHINLGTAWDATATDNCTVSSLTYALTGVTTGTGTTLNGVTFNLGTTTVTWTAVDNSGNTSTCTFDVVTTDTQDPVIVSCGGSGTEPVVSDPGACTYTQTGTGWDATATDNCTVTSLSYALTGSTTGTGTSLSGVVFNLGTTNVVWTAVDTAGNTATCSFDVAVTDTQDPVISNCASLTNQTEVTDVGVCSYTQTGTAWDATATDNCTVTSLSYALTGSTTGTGTTLNGITFNLGITNVVWTAVDTAGNTTTCSFDVTVTDTQDPVISNCASLTDQSEVTDSGVCTYTQTGTAWDAIGTDNCTVSSLTYVLTGSTTGTGTTLNGVVFQLGITNVVWTVVDTAGNTTTCSFDVTVTDTQDPVISSCGATGIQNVVTDFGVCTHINLGTGWDATATDNCGIASLSYNLTGVTTGTGTTLNGVTFNLGTTTVTWTAVDNSGNTSTCTFDVVTTDTQDPVIVSCGGSGTEPVVSDPGACTYTQTGTGWDAIATDNCTVTSLSYTLTGATTGTGTSLNGVVFNLGITGVTWTATDTAGNFATCTFNVAVTDNQDPVISNCASLTNQSVVTNPGVCSYTQTGTGWDATATDNCTVNSLAYALSGATTGSGTSLNGVVFQLGTTNVVWTAVDGSGNSSTCTFDVTVTDNQDPVISSCGGSGTEAVVVDPSTCTYTQAGTGWDATATDNCTVSSLSYILTGVTTGTGTTLNGVSFNLGTTTVTWTAVDNAGNSSTCTFDVIVTDGQDPVISSCGATGTQNVVTDFGVCTHINTGIGWDATATDNCGIASLTYTLTGVTTGTGTTLNGVVFNLGTTTVTWTAVDNAGNTSTCTFNVVTTDNQDPVISSCGGIGTETVVSDLGACTYTQVGIGWDAVATDNCTVTSLTYTLAGATTGTGTTLNGVTFNLGTTTVTWTVTDASGNTATCTFNVNVTDNQDPVISNCASLTNQSEVTDAGVCTYTQTGTAWDATGTDNCTVSSLTYALTGVTTGTGTTLNGVTFNLGTTNVVWTVVDTAGNTATCSFDVTITDNEDPIMVSCGGLGTEVVVVDSSACTYAHVGTAWDATATDNCTVSNIAYVLTGSTIGSGTSLDGVVFNLGTTTVTWTVTDAAGNIATCSFDVAVTDNELPQISCQADYESCDSLVTFTTPTATDNCGVVSVLQTTGLPSGSVFPVGTTVVTFEALDVNGNTNTCSFNVTINPTPVLSTTSTNITCNTYGDGTIDLTVTNGIFPFTFAWSNGDTTEDLSTLQPGSYNVTVTDVNGCANSTDSIVITEPTAVNAVATVTSDYNGSPISCNSAMDGEGIVVGTGGTGEFSYSWSNGQTNAIVTGLDAAIYTVTVTDANGCTDTSSIDLSGTEPIAVDVTATVSSNYNGQDISCYGAMDGEGTAIATGGTGNLTYLWSNGQTTGIATGLDAMTYSVTVTDENACWDTTTIVLTQPDGLSSEKVSQINVSCNGFSDAFMTLTTNGGVGGYSYLWSDGQTNATATGLSVGAYTVTTTDANGCSVVDNAGIITEPQVLNLTSTLTPAMCALPTGGIDLTVSGGTAAYSYQWSNGTTTEDLNGISGGYYAVTVTDANACIVEWEDTLNQSNIVPTVSGEVTPHNCYLENSGSIELSVGSGVAPFTFNWSNGMVDSVIYNIGQGGYAVTVTDANGCSVTGTYAIQYTDSPLDLTLTSPFVNNGYNITNYLSSDGVIDATVTGGDPIYTYIWSNGETVEDLDGIQDAGWYYLTVTDANGCTVSEGIEIIALPELPQGISPNDDNLNDVFVIKYIEFYPDNILTIYNRWGEEIITIENYTEQGQWWGQNKEGMDLPEGTYFAILVVKINGEERVFKDHVDIRR